MKRIFFLTGLYIVSLFLFGCREEVISPNNPAGNINDPIQLRTNYSYTFLINAQNFSMNIKEDTFLNFDKSLITYKLTDYVAGSINVIIFNNQKQQIYSKTLSGTDGTIPSNVVDENPSRIEIKFNDFSGKFTVKLSHFSE
jgi:hypothetical protein